jgi:arabinogalactan endo-1,4-beta-galactosidase
MPAEASESIVTLTGLTQKVTSTTGTAAWLTTTLQEYTSGTPQVKVSCAANEQADSRSQAVTFFSAKDTLVLTIRQAGKQQAETRFVGGDISLLTKYEQQGAQYKDKNGNTITNVISFLKEQGWNTLRVRLFVDPTNSDDRKSCVQDLDYVIALGKRIKQAGMFFMLDFHYSDTWADPGSQWTPAAWLTLNDEQLAQQVYDYTSDCLNMLNSAGATPDLIQTGNEISYGMMWGEKGTTQNRCYTNSSAANWNRFYSLLRQATRACREKCPQARIILHSERVPAPSVLTDFFDRMKTQAIDYDIIGLSYYSYFHGKLNQLNSALDALVAKNYGKAIQIVEFGYPFKWEIGGTTTDYTANYPLTNEGQRKFTADLITLLKQYPLVEGLSWWYAEANAFGCSGDLNSGWYNASLFDNETGKALNALYEMKNFKNN